MSKITLESLGLEIEQYIKFQINNEIQLLKKYIDSEIKKVVYNIETIPDFKLKQKEETKKTNLNNLVSDYIKLESLKKLFLESYDMIKLNENEDITLTFTTEDIRTNCDEKVSRTEKGCDFYPLLDKLLSCDTLEEILFYVYFFFIKKKDLSFFETEDYKDNNTLYDVYKRLYLERKGINGISPNDFMISKNIENLKEEYLEMHEKNIVEYYGYKRKKHYPNASIKK